ncbi:energy transducer TonB [Pelomonas sp. KK5]|uniref:energy transducer TonB n=1 Tax=Pelomonas sp. KK5 TaxID=1855730 RepID=UPI00097C7466|nr:energy transducer TonB [Pelomonas sp. KK5]
MELALPPRPDGGSSHAVGIGVVVAVHLVIGYAIVSGLAQRVVDLVKEPIEARLIDEPKPAPPPPPPPEPPKAAIVRTAPPPPAAPYVPPPEVVVAAPAAPAPTITAAASPVPPPVVQEAKPAPPPAPPVRGSEPVPLSVACPTQVAPVLPRRATQEGISGQVRAQATIRGGKVVDVQILASRPRGLFDAAVRNALLQYDCNASGADEIVAVQTFDFRPD